MIVLAVGGSYLQLIATGARLEAAAAQVQSFQAVCRQAMDRLEAGLATRVDVTRSLVELQTEQQRMRSLQGALETQKLRLARIIGLPLGQPFNSVDAYRFSPLTGLSQEVALRRAQAQRADLRAAETGMHAAETAVQAAKAERAPAVSVSADFGAAGITPTHKSIGVFNVSGTLLIPLYEGGRIHGNIEQANASFVNAKPSSTICADRWIKMCDRHLLISNQARAALFTVYCRRRTRRVTTLRSYNVCRCVSVSSQDKTATSVSRPA